MVEKTRPGLSQIEEDWKKQKEAMKASADEASKAKVPCEHGNTFSCDKGKCFAERKRMLETMRTDGTTPKEDDALMEATRKGLEKAVEQSGKRKP